MGRKALPGIVEGVEGQTLSQVREEAPRRPRSRQAEARGDARRSPGAEEGCQRQSLTSTKQQQQHHETAGTNCGSSFEISLLPARRRILSHNQPELLFHFSVIFPARERKIASICVLKCPFFY